MFEIFRDIVLEMKGIDSEKAELERIKRKTEKKDREKKEKIIIPIWIKKIIFWFCMLYLISSLGTFPLMVKSGISILVIRNIIQVAIAITLLVLVNFKNKKTEIMTIILSIIFIVLQNSGLFIMANL